MLHILTLEEYLSEGKISTAYNNFQSKRHSKKLMNYIESNCKKVGENKYDCRKGKINAVKLFKMEKKLNKYMDKINK